MIRNNLFLILPIVLLFSLLVGCNSDPVSQDIEPENTPILNQSVQIENAHQFLGYYKFVIDTQMGEVEVVPLRGAEWHFNLTGVLNTAMGVGAVMVPGESDPPNGLFVLDVTLTHPFDTSPQFAGFDVKGILMTPGTLVAGSDVFADVGETNLENADGYTRWWNPTEFTTPGMFGYVEGDLAMGATGALTATVNPYKYFADILDSIAPLSWLSGTPLDDPQGRGVFTAGSANTRRYEINFPLPGPQVIYGYAIDASWNMPSPNPPAEVPDDFPIEANQPDPYRVVLQSTFNNLYYDVDTTTGGGVLRLQINVHDWQGQLAGDIASEITSVQIYAPGLMAGPVDAVFLNESADKVRYTADLAGFASPPAVGEYKVICRVESSDGSTYQQAAAPAPDEPLASYGAIMVEVTDPECESDSNNLPLEAEPIGFGEIIGSTICGPVDLADYYTFEIFAGYEARGSINIFSDAEQTHMTLFDELLGNIESTGSFTGAASIDLDSHDLLPGVYYIYVAISGPDGIRPYMVELDAEAIDVTPTNPVEVTPPGLFVDPYEVFQNGNYAFIVGANVWVYDISDPTNPILEYYDDTTIGDRVAFYYPYLYHAHSTLPSETSMDLIDFTDPVNPVHTEGVLTITTYAGSRMAINSTNLYVKTGTSPAWDVVIYDYGSDPYNPVEVGSIPVFFEIWSMALLDAEGPDTHLALGEDNEIHGYCVEAPGSVTSIPNFLFGFGRANHMTADGDLLYVTYDYGGWDIHLEIIELDHPGSAFSYLGTADTPGSGGNLIVDSPYVYMADYASGVAVCDVTDPTTPTFETSLPMISDCYFISLEGDILCAAMLTAGMQIFDVSIPTTPTELYTFPVVNYPQDAVATGDYLLVSCTEMEHNTIRTLDISDPANAHVVAEYELGDYAPSFMSLDGTNLVVAVQDSTDYYWHLVDVSDPVNLSSDGFLLFPDNIYDILRVNDVTYISTSAPEVRVFDCSITPPLSGGTLALPAVGYSLTTFEDTLYVTTTTSAEIYSLTDPVNPVYVDTYLLGTNVDESVAANGYLYTILNDEIAISTLATPTAPVWINTLDVGPTGDFSSIVVDGQFAYVVGSCTSPYACGVVPPDVAYVASQFHTHDWYGATQLVIHDGYLYEIANYTGIHIWDLL